MTLRKNINDAVVILLITIFLLFIIELALRFIYPNKVTDFKGAYRFDPVSLVELNSNISKKFERSKINGGEIISWKTNSHGFRGAELQKNPDLRVMVYGDSNIQARFSKNINTYPSKLAKSLSETTSGEIETINAGLVGAGPDQNLLRFMRDSDKFKPDIIVFHIFADNDYGDLIKNRLFNLNSSGDLISSNMPKEIDFVISKRESISYFISSLLIVKVAKKLIPQKKVPSVNTQETLDLYTTRLANAYKLFKDNLPRKFSHFGDHYDLDVATNPTSESAMVKVRFMQAVLVKAFEYAKKHNIKFLVQIQPSVVDMTKNNSLDYEDLKKFTAYKSTNLTYLTQKICESNNIPFINLYDAYSKNNPEGLFLKGQNNHWSDLGQDLAAKVSAKYISTHFLK